MRAFIVLVLAILLPLVSAQVSANYDIIVDDSGASLVVLTLSGEGETSLLLPADVSDPVVEGAPYITEGSELYVSVSGGLPCTVMYVTDYFTGKQGAEWSASLAMPENISDAYVKISLPQDARFVSASPSPPLLSRTNDSLTASWLFNSSPPASISLVYSISQTPITPPTGQPQTNPQTQQPTDYSLLFAVLVILLLAVISAFYLWRKSAAKSKPKLEVTEGMRNVMKALNESDVKLIEAIIDAGGEIKRSTLERKTEMAKSSLALALGRLESKNIIKMDKERASHHVMLTEWFRSL
ncbi:MAG: hypothetical protein NT157_02905 [Candidatus Micrarchaeota archaeon]|nr:hypothetical protein [Candidatus Micrarchaeota archaeon]